MSNRGWKFLVRTHDEIEIEQQVPNDQTIKALNHFKECRENRIHSIDKVRNELEKFETGYKIGALAHLAQGATPGKIASASLLNKMQRLDHEIQNLKDGLASGNESQRLRFVALWDFICNVLNEPPIVVILPMLEVVERVKSKSSRGGRPRNAEGEKGVPSRPRLERAIEMDRYVLCHSNTPAGAARKVAASHPTNADHQSQLKTLEKDYRWKLKRRQREGA